MISLLPNEHDALQAVVKAGAAGVPVAGLPRDALFGLCLEGLARVPKGDTRVYATTKGTAFRERVTL